MSGFPFMNPGRNLNFLPPYYTYDVNGKPVVQSNVFLQSSTPAFQNNSQAAIFIDYDDPNRQLSPIAGPRIRRRTGAVGEPVKFRRTRSGCFTCRNRRVKCDEGRPICERCRKGSRDCSYPEPASATTNSKHRKSSSSDKIKDTNEHEDITDDSVDDIEDDDPLSAATTSDSAKSPLNHKCYQITSESVSDSPNLADIESVSDTADSIAQHSSLSCRIAQLPENIRDLLLFTKNYLTHWHYNLPADTSNFVEKGILENAIIFEPLQYAVCSFAAYHRSLRCIDSDMNEFLHYYSKSIQLLHSSLSNLKKHTFLTLLTMLQLASIEEMLGDWVNLKAHQQAASKVITEIYTPQTISANPLKRAVFNYYLHFDSYVGIFSGTPSFTSRIWLEAVADEIRVQHEKNPTDILTAYEHCLALVRLLSFDCFKLFREMAAKQLTQEEIDDTVKSISERFSNWDENFPVRLMKPENAITMIPNSPYNPDDHEDPYKTGVIFVGDNFETNGFRIAMLCLRNLFEHEMTKSQGLYTENQLNDDFANVLTGVINAVRFLPEAPPGAFLTLRSIWSFATLICPPRTTRQLNWVLETFAAFELEGYIWPEAVKSRFQAMFFSNFQVDISEWWLPDKSVVPQILLQARAFVKERTHPNLDDESESLRDMKGVFSTLSISSASSPDSNVYSPPSTTATPRII